MIRSSKTILAACLIALSSAITAPSAPITVDLTGNTSWEGWNDLSSNTHGAYGGGFPGTTAWPQGISSNLGSGDALLNKTENGEDGGAFLASTSIYVGGFSTEPNIFGGTLSVLEAAPLPAVKTIVFQLQIGEALGYDLFDNAAPILLINGEQISYTSTFSNILNQVDNGVFQSPVGPQQLYINTWAFQWDLSFYSQPITSFEIRFSPVQHSQIYALQLDQSDAIYTAAVPEPSTFLLLVIGFATALILRKKVVSYCPKGQTAA